jgi:hypothetical protein
MPVVMNMRWNGVTPDQYDTACANVGWETEVPPGAKYHVAAFDGSALIVTDVWESAADFNRFVEQRLMPAVKEIGIEGQPEVQITEVHRVFAPNPG